MRKLLKRGGVALAGLAVLAALLLLFSQGADNASATHGTTAVPPSPFSPIYSADFPETGDQCGNNLDDDGDGLVNQGCEVGLGVISETGTDCTNTSDDDDNYPPTSAVDPDGLINDGCPAVGSIPEFNMCTGVDVVIPARFGAGVDDDGDGTADDGCTGGPSQVGLAPEFEMCFNSISDDTVFSLDPTETTFSISAEFKDNSPSDDTIVRTTGSWVADRFVAGKTITVSGTTSNDGAFLIASVAALVLTLDSAVTLADEGPLTATIDNGFPVVNDGCPINPPGSIEDAAAGECTNSIDDDSDGIVNDGCPAPPAAATSGAGGSSNVRQTFTTGLFDPAGAFGPAALGGHFPEQGPAFTPCVSFPDLTTNCWVVTAGTAMPHGAIVGSAVSVINLGFVNGPCVTPIVVGPLELVNASVDVTNTLVTSTNFNNWVVDDFSPTDDPSLAPATGTPNGVADGADFYPDVLAAILDPNVFGAPLQRSYAQLPNFLGSGSNVPIDLITYAPGQLEPIGIPASLGFATILIVEAFNPALPSTPSLITDQCGFQFAGTAAKESKGPGAASPVPNRVNPAIAGTQIFFDVGNSRRDADLDGFDNDGDRCPFIPTSPNSLVPGLGHLTLDLFDLDGIPVGCDPSPANVGAGDHDGDGFLNAQDNCPLVVNGLVGGVSVASTQRESEPPQPFDGGPQTDAIGDACDPNPTVPDGHFISSLSTAPVCITGTFTTGPATGLPATDIDGDGFCDAEEAGLGSLAPPPFGAPCAPPFPKLPNACNSSTPENLGIPGTCDNGADDDKDGLFDVDDTGCVVGDGSHDLKIVKITGSKSITAQGKATLNVKIQNLSGVTESVVLGIQVTASAPPAFPFGPLTGLPGCYPITATLAGESETTAFGFLGTTEVPGSGATLHVKLQVPVNCPSAAGVSGDYDVTFDICHAGDPAPLGLFGVGACPGPIGGDGNQDRTNRSNDAPFSLPFLLDQP